LLLTGVCLATLVYGFDNLGRPNMPAWRIAALLGTSAVTGLLYWRHARRTPYAILDLTVLRIHTRDNAQAMGLGAVTGSIEVGKAADLIVLSQNPFRVPVGQVHRTKVLRTYLQGRLVYDGLMEKRQQP
jgi:predicted amidohydrolase YtcJ